MDQPWWNLLKNLEKQNYQPFKNGITPLMPKSESMSNMPLLESKDVELSKNDAVSTIRSEIYV